MRRLALALLLGLAACEPGGDAVYQGYAEGEYLQMAPEASGRLIQLAVARGDRVRAGDLLFQLDAREATIARDQAAADLAEASARLADDLALAGAGAAAIVVLPCGKKSVPTGSPATTASRMPGSRLMRVPWLSSAYSKPSSRISRSSATSSGGAGGLGGSLRLRRLISFTMRKMMKARMMKLSEIVMKLP